MLFGSPIERTGTAPMRRILAPWAIATAVAMAFATVACGGGSSSQQTLGAIHNINAPADIFVSLGVAGLGCSVQPTRLNANGARVAVCAPIAGIPKAFLSIGMYPTADIAQQQYLKNCHYGGWSLYRHGENWRGVMSLKVPLQTARRIAVVLQTDLRGSCTKTSPSGLG